ncbi:MAG: amidohydrolase family protein [Woeseiaceae bacterium]|nr:amidohydrolase family protein [Woeseiaceae bacterium]
MLPIARIILIGLLALLSTAAPAQDGAYALTNVNIFNGNRNRIFEDRTLLVRDGKIERMQAGDEPVPAGYELIDCEQNYLMPGMIDVHTHVSSLESARRALESGVTTVRTAGVAAYQDIGLRELARAGKIPGPDVVAAGVFVTSNLADAVLADVRLKDLADGVNSEEELRLLVNVNADRGVDVIKTRSTERAGLPETDPRRQAYTRRQLEVIVEEAAKHDIPVLVHAHGDAGARAAVLAGARSIEHGTYLSQETIRLMKERGTFFVPTYDTIQENLEERFHYVLRLRAKSMLPHLDYAVREAYRQGVKIATGADNNYDTESLNRISIEVAHFARLGMSNFDALQTATVNAAELLRIDDHTGRIADGFDADLILVPGNPLEDVAALQDVLLVMSNGQIALKRIPFAIEE